jgi:hypothetical protein
MRTLASLALLFIATSCGPNLGTKLQEETPRGTATFYHTAAVDAATAGKVFKAMIDGNYNFGKELAVQLDKVADRLTLRTCHDNMDSIASVIKDGEKDGSVSYMHGLALHVSKAIDNQEVDVVMCKLRIAEPFYTVKWQAPK